MFCSDAVPVSNSLPSDIPKVSPYFIKNSKAPHPNGTLDKAVIYKGFIFGEKGKGEGEGKERKWKKKKNLILIA